VAVAESLVLLKVTVSETDRLEEGEKLAAVCDSVVCDNVKLLV
jgi:hypothetical protein